MDQVKRSDNRKTYLHRHYPLPKKRKPEDKKGNLNQTQETIMYTGVLYSSTGIKCLLCQNPIEIPEDRIDTNITRTNPFIQPAYPHCQEILNILKLAESLKLQCKCTGRSIETCPGNNCNCSDELIPLEPPEARIEIGSKPRIIAKTFWPYQGNMGPIIITRVTSRPTKHCKLTITAEEMLQAAKVSLDTHECSACITTDSKKCGKPLSKHLIDTLDRKGYQDISSEQIIVKWAENEHLRKTRQQHLNTPLEILEQDNFTENFYNYVNNNQDKLEKWLNENIATGLVIRMKPATINPNKKTKSKKSITPRTPPFSIYSNQQSIVGWKEGTYLTKRKIWTPEQLRKAATLGELRATLLECPNNKQLSKNK